MSTADPTFPAFTLEMGELDAETRRWAEQLAATGAFTAPRLVHVPARTVVFLSETSDLGLAGIASIDGARVIAPAANQVRLYRVATLWLGLLERAGVEREALVRAFHRALAQSAGGCLALVTQLHDRASLGVRNLALTGVLAHWDALATLRYVDHDVAPVSLDALIAERCVGLLAMWRPDPPGAVRHDLEAARHTLEAADAATRRDRAVAYLRALASTSRRIQHRAALTEARLRDTLAALDPGFREAIEAGDTAQALTVLHRLDRELGGRSDPLN